MKKVILLLVVLAIMFNVVHAANEGSDIRITLINQDPDPVSPASYFDVRFKLENYGNGKVSDVFIKVIPQRPLSLEEDEVRAIGGLQGLQINDQGLIQKFRLKVASDAIEGQAPIKIAYRIGEKGDWSEKGPFYINVESSNKVISIEKYFTTPERFKAGLSGNLHIGLTSFADIELKDIRIKLTTDEHIHTIGNTNEKIIQTMKSGEKQTLDFDIIVDSTAATGVYSVPITITYKDYKENSFTIQNTLSVIVDNTPEILVNLDSSDIKKASTKGKIQISISNSGVSDVKFLSYRLIPSDQYDILSNGFSFIGNINSDDFETIDSEIFVKDVKEDVMLNTEIKYKDSFNKDYTVQKSLSLKIYSQDEMIKYGLEAPKNTNSKYLFMIGAIILMIYWLFQFIDLMKTKMALYKKLLWVVIFLIALPIGALLFQFFGKSRGTD